MRAPRYGEAVFQLGIDHSVAADDERTRLMNLLLTAGEDFREYLEWQILRRKRDDIERRKRLSSHRVDIRESVRSRDLTEVERVVDDRGEEIHRLHQREIIGQAKDPGVVEGF